MTFIAQPTNFVNQNVPVSEQNLMDALEHEPPQPRPPVIIVDPGRLDLAASKAEQALIRSGVPIYQRGNELVRPGQCEVSAGGGRVTTAASLVRIGLPGLVDALSGAAWWKIDGRSGNQVRIDPPEKVAAIVLARGRPVDPAADRRGDLDADAPPRRLDAGGARLRRDHPLIPDARPRPGSARHAERPTREMLDRGARQALLLLEGFPFVSNADRSVALAAMLTPVVRGAIETAPLTAVRASTAGTGKSFLVDVASVIATGRPCPVISGGS